MHLWLVWRYGTLSWSLKCDILVPIRLRSRRVYYSYMYVFVCTRVQVIYDCASERWRWTRPVTRQRKNALLRPSRVCVQPKPRLTPVTALSRCRWWRSVTVMMCSLSRARRSSAAPFQTLLPPTSSGENPPQTYSVTAQTCSHVTPRTRPGTRLMPCSVTAVCSRRFCVVAAPRRRHQPLDVVVLALRPLTPPPSRSLLRSAGRRPRRPRHCIGRPASQALTDDESCSTWEARATRWCGGLWTECHTRGSVDCDSVPPTVQKHSLTSAMTS